MASILIIEDKTPIRGNPFRFLRLEGFVIFAAKKGGGALSSFVSRCPT
jgi:hypothetical protein